MQANMAVTPAGKRAMQACINHSQSGVKCRASWRRILRGGVNRYVSLQRLFPRCCHQPCKIASIIPRRVKMRCKQASNLTWPGNPPCQPAAAIPPGTVMGHASLHKSLRGILRGHVNVASRNLLFRCSYVRLKCPGGSVHTKQLQLGSFFVEEICRIKKKSPR
jgi:hypothetical protein